MKILEKKKEVYYIIENSNISVIYFTGRDCGACEAIKFKVKEILKMFPEIKGVEIDGENHPDICAEFNVFSLPLLILYVDKKESIRIGRNIDLLSLKMMIKRYYNIIYEK